MILDNITYYILFSLLFLSSCQKDSDSVMMRIVGETQGTFYSVKYISEDRSDYQSSIDSILLEVDNTFSSWKDSSMISLLNKGNKVRVNKMFLDVFEIANQIYIETDGLFDCSIAPLVNYWGYGRDPISSEVSLFDSSEVRLILDLVQFSRITVIEDSLQLPNGMMLDFNAIAQGYTVDMISDFLISNGVKNFLVDIGGEIRSNGRNFEDQYWKVGIDKPEEGNIKRDLQVIVSLENLSIATSGNYRKYKEINGVKYSHIISPITGYFARNRMLSASVLTSSCIKADAYATVFMIMGIEKSKRFIKYRDDLDFYFVYTNDQGEWQTFATTGLIDNIKKGDNDKANKSF